MTTPENQRAREWFIIFICAVLFVFIMVLEFQVRSRNEAIDKVTAAANNSYAASQDARAAAQEARDELRTAIKLSSDPARATATANALASIQRIEVFLCGGPCPSGGPP